MSTEELDPRELSLKANTALLPYFQGRSDDALRELPMSPSKVARTPARAIAKLKRHQVVETASSPILRRLRTCRSV